MDVLLKGNLLCFAILFTRFDLLKHITECASVSTKDLCDICMTTPDTQWDGEMASCNNGQFYRLTPLQLFSRFKKYGKNI